MNRRTRADNSLNLVRIPFPFDFRSHSFSIFPSSREILFWKRNRAHCRRGHFHNFFLFLILLLWSCCLSPTSIANTSEKINVSRTPRTFRLGRSAGNLAASGHSDSPLHVHWSVLGKLGSCWKIYVTFSRLPRKHRAFSLNPFRPLPATSYSFWLSVPALIARRTFLELLRAQKIGVSHGRILVFE